MNARLWLFDIDGTLVDTAGAGLQSLTEAAMATFGDPGPSLDLAGSTDLGLVQDFLDHFGLPAEESTIHRFFDYYHERLEWNLVHGRFPGRVLPGVYELLKRLSTSPDRHLGLLTGNTAVGARAKMRHFGLDAYFPFGGFGCDFADRNRLGPVAVSRAEAHTGSRFSLDEIVVIGDTPKDIACARALGSPCIAVATGHFSLEELMAHAPTRAIRNLEEL